MIEVRIGFHLVNSLIGRKFRRHFQKLLVSLELIKSLNTFTILLLPTKRCAVEEGSSGVLKWRPLILLIKCLISFDFSHGDLFSMVLLIQKNQEKETHSRIKPRLSIKKAFPKILKKN